jgi:hypothetical protein
MSTEITVVNDIIEINVTEEPVIIEAPSGAYPLPTGVYSVYGRTGNVVAQEGDYTLTLLGDVTIVTPSNGQVLRYNGTAWVNSTESYVGTVTSVAASVPTGLTISGSPITTSGTLAFGLGTGYVIPLQSTLDAKALKAITISTTAPLTGGGDLSANRTFAIPQSTTSVDGYLSATDWTTFNAKQAALSGSGIVKSTAGVITYLTDNTSNWDTAYNRSLTSAAVTGTTTKTLTLNQQSGGTITASWTDDNTDAVTSVFGRTGAVVATSGDYNTLQVTENTNLYFTDQRARYAVSGDTTSGVVYSNATGIIALDDIPNTSLINSSVTVNGSTVALGGTTSFTTTAVTEGTNLYYTDTRARAAITGTAPISVLSGVVSISQSGSSTNGYLSSADWNTFNGKQSALTLGNLTSSDITVTGGTAAIIGAGSTLTLATVNTNVGAYGDSTNVPTITVNAKGLVTAASQTAIPTATSSVTGLLTSTDWSTFNSKQAQLNGTGFVKASGTTITYDNSTYLTTISGIAAGGELSGTYANPTLVNSAVIGKVLTGVNITGGTVVDTDSILTAFGKVQNQINGLIGGSIYQGTWNASTNTPTLTSSVGTAGNYYIVSVAGTTNLNGITDWQIGDWVIYQGSEWEKVDNTDAVVSVNGYTGAVSLTTTDISEGTNLYYTDVRARTSLSASTGISYNSTTGVITNSLPDQTVTLTGAGTTSISGAYPSFTITSNDTYNGTVTSVAVTESGSALTITGSPVTTSGTINIGFAGAASQYVAGDGSLVTFPSIPSISGLVPYTGATNNVDLGTHSLTATDLVVNHASGIGVAASITKGGNGEALTVVKSSGSGNAASITGGVTQLDELHLTTDLADTYIASATTWNAKQNAITLTTTGNSGASTLVGATLNVPTYTLAGLGGINLTSISATSPLLYDNTTGVFSIQQSSGSQAGYLSSADWTTFNGKESVLTFSSPLVRTTNTISIPAATTSVNGYLTSTDWTTFNNKQSTITNPVTGTGTQNYHTKWNNAGGTSIGNSLIWDNGTNVGIGNQGTTYTLDVSGTGRFTGQLHIPNNSTGTNAGLFFDYNANSASRSWCIVSDYDAYGDFQIKQSTTQTGTTFAKILGFTATGAATFSSTVTSQANGSTFGTAGATGRALIVQAGSTGGAIRFQNAAGGDGTLFINGTSTSVDYNFNTYSVGDALVIKNSGNVLIGTTTDSGIKLQVTGGGKFTSTVEATEFAASVAITIQKAGANGIGDGPFYRYINSTNAAQFLRQLNASSGEDLWTYNTSTAWTKVGNTNAGSGAYTPLSDINKKKDFELSTLGLDAILGLKPTLYRMKSEDESTNKQLGFIAQDVKEFIPQAYIEEGEEDGKFIGLSYNAITATLVKAIQEQQIQIQNLQEQINILAK